MQSDLIFDIGCNDGDDTSFYLRKGFRVVAVDADQKLCEKVSERFRREIESRQLSVVCGLFTPEQGDSAPFFLVEAASGRNTADPYFKARVEAAGLKAIETLVPAVRMAELFRRYGVPYYIKIDIEGMDIVPLKELNSLSGERPAYVSIEMAQHDLALGLEQLVTLIKSGYTKFLFFNEGMRRHVRAPNPPQEGKFAQFYPEQNTTGLFGRELSGRWLNIYEATTRLSEICRLHALFRDDPRYSKNGGFGGTLRSKIHNRFRRHILHDPVVLFDLHATI
jgi:FkbM family methyltransferase